MNPSNSFVESNVVSIDVGGQIFQTTKQTLSLAGPDSLFARLAKSTQLDPPFVDREPELFSMLLSLLRSGNLPSKARGLFDLQDLIQESKFYGVENLLINCLSNPSQFEAFNLEKTLILPLNGRDSPSSISATSSGNLHVAHGSKITSFDWSLRRKATILTQFSAIDSLLEISPRIAAAGATDFPGLQIIDLENGLVRDTLNWENITRSSSTVQAIASSPEYLFTSFESSRRNSNTIIVYDLHTLMPVTEIAHCEIYGADIHSGIPSTKLRWVPANNLVLAAGSHSGPSGIFGHIRFWDIRSKNMVFEIKEKVDCFSDITVSDNLSAIFKVGMISGEVFFSDFRNLGAEDPWVCLGDNRKTLNGKREGKGCKIESRGNHVFCSKGGIIELWSEILMRNGSSQERLGDRVFKKNLLGRTKDLGGNNISLLAFGGNKMFVTRKDRQCVEVWQSSAQGF